MRMDASFALSGTEEVRPRGGSGVFLLKATINWLLDYYSKVEQRMRKADKNETREKNK